MGFRKHASSAGVATEVASLRWLAEATEHGGAPVAELINHGTDWLETVEIHTEHPTREAARRFGHQLAHTHATGADFYGQAPPGLTPEQNRLAEVEAPAAAEPTWETWGEFYAEARLRPYLHGIDAANRARVERAIDVVAEGRFDSPQPRLVNNVARIHGDLWAGNVLWSGGTGVLIDPSAHGGHAETDLAELALFSAPYWEDIVAGYHEASPLADGYLERVEVHYFHMLIMHAALFGGGYVGRTVELARQLLR